MIKSIRHLLLALLYLGVIIICALMVVKPGSSIFYNKQTIDDETITPDAGYAYRIKLNLNPLLFRLPGVLVFEDDNQLGRSEDNIVVDSGMGTYSLDEASPGQGYVFFSSTDNSDPINNGRTYTLYIPLKPISRSTGLIGLALLLPGLTWFVFFVIRDPANRLTLIHNPEGVLLVLDRFCEYGSNTIRSNSGTTWGQQIKARQVYWKQLFTITILAAYFCIFMEWIFFITKPSFMSMMGALEKIGVFVLSGLAFALLGMAAITAYILLDLLLISLRLPGMSRLLIAFIPTVIVSILALLMMDNFTYTVFKFGISTSTSIWRGAYALLFIIIFVYIYSRLLNYFGVHRKNPQVTQPSNRLFNLTVIVLIISTGWALTSLDLNQETVAGRQADSEQASSYPNIILLGSDGVSAENMSVYGYERDTTPRLNELAQNSLVAENAFSNSTNSAGSVISIFTSKLPTQTRVLYAPDILTGVNSYQHLPGILKREGYSTVEFGMPDYVDAYSLNVQYGFDMVNGQTRQGKVYTLGQALGYEDVSYFLYKLAGRVSDRIQHIYFIRDMQNPYNIVTRPIRIISDQDKIAQMLKFIDESQGPVFAHVHLLGTHGPIFTPPVQVYSKGEVQEKNWMVDFYDDAILAFDQHVSEAIDGLTARMQYDNTILIIYSDHATVFQVNERIPLIIHFPNDAHAGRISQNAQNLDIAPTILDYLGLSVPDWMSGMSLLNGQQDSSRLIFSAGTGKVAVNQQGFFALDPNQVKPPFYQFSMMNIVDCQKWYNLDMNTYNWTSGDVAGYVEPCAAGILRSFGEINQALADRLTLDGFDISSLP